VILVTTEPKSADVCGQTVLITDDGFTREVWQLNKINYEQAQVAYKNGDYVDALKSYYATLKNDSDSFEPGEKGLVYYRVGNCLLKMHSFNEAAVSYKKALEDADFASRGAANVNLGKSLLGEGRFEEAVSAFNAALSESSYDKAYQAQMGLGTAYSKLGMVMDAGNAYRNAALDERNPNPAKALISLGSCFMALGRPQDAIESYNAIFEFDPALAIQQKTYESLGQAYTVSGHYQEAVDAFSKALAPGGFSLSTQAQADYSQALAALGLVGGQPTNTGLATGVLPYDNTGDALFGAAQHDESEGYGAGNVPTAHDTGFFDTAEDDLVKMSKDQMKDERKLKHTGLKVALGIVIFLILVLGAGVFGFTQGYGFPMQDAVITDLFNATADGRDTTQYWIGTSDEEKQAIERIMDMVAPTKSIDIIYLERSMTTSNAVVTAHLPQGGQINYEISLERSGIGWKISSLNLYFG
jgi:tetratricopeptide (TPR) repeat protein